LMSGTARLVRILLLQKSSNYIFILSFDELNLFFSQQMVINAMQVCQNPYLTIAPHKPKGIQATGFT
jgi:hypothetical protein